jgi:hypothetical protein
VITPIQCERPTKTTGSSCKNYLQPGQLACTAHETEHDRLLMARLREQAKLGLEFDAVRAASDAIERARQAGYEHGVRVGERQARREQKDAENFRLRDDSGRQLVQLNGGLTYAWSGTLDLLVGDLVVVPAPYWQPDHRPSTYKVEKVGSSYRGYLVEIIRRTTGE